MKNSSEQIQIETRRVNADCCITKYVWELGYKAICEIEDQILNSE